MQPFSCCCFRIYLFIVFLTFFSFCFYANAPWLTWARVGAQYTSWVFKYYYVRAPYGTWHHDRTHIKRRMNNYFYIIIAVRVRIICILGVCAEFDMISPRVSYRARSPGKGGGLSAANNMTIHIYRVVVLSHSAASGLIRHRLKSDLLRSNTISFHDRRSNKWFRSEGVGDGYRVSRVKWMVYIPARKP